VRMKREPRIVLRSTGVRHVVFSLDEMKKKKGGEEKKLLRPLKVVTRKLFFSKSRTSKISLPKKRRGLEVRQD